jgi:hypothetical protein
MFPRFVGPHPAQHGQVALKARSADGVFASVQHGYVTDQQLIGKRSAMY